MDRIFGNQSPDAALNGCYVALWASSPTNSPSNANEISGGSYSPQQVTASGWSVSQSFGPREYTNDNAISFGQLDSSSNITVAGVVLYDGPDTTNDNALYYEDLSGGSTTVAAGDQFEINAGGITIQED